MVARGHRVAQVAAAAAAADSDSAVDNVAVPVAAHGILAVGYYPIVGVALDE